MIISKHGFNVRLTGQRAKRAGMIMEKGSFSKEKIRWWLRYLFNMRSANDELTSYRYPIIKILFFAVFWCMLTLRGYVFNYDTTVKKIIDYVIVSGFIPLVGICSIIAFAEMILVYENKETEKKLKRKKAYDMPVDKIVSLAEENDIIEFMIAADDKKIKIGASSDYEYNKFFDKRFYIEKQEYENIDEFREKVQEFSDNGTIKVVSIDGVSPKYYT